MPSLRYMEFLQAWLADILDRISGGLISRMSCFRTLTTGMTFSMELKDREETTVLAHGIVPRVHLVSNINGMLQSGQTGYIPRYISKVEYGERVSTPGFKTRSDCSKSIEHLGGRQVSVRLETGKKRPGY